MRTITDLTDLQIIEDKIEEFVASASNLPDIEDQQKVYWNGFDHERKRPFATIGVVTQSTLGKPWETRSRVSNALRTVKFAPFTWAVDINFYTDSYIETEDDEHVANRDTATHFAQRLQNRAFLTDNKNILDSVNIAYSQLGQIVQGIQTQDEDKFIQQATLEFRFNGIAETEILDSDYFETVETDTTLSGE